jgi:2-dehydropantoate 2-reductase
MKIAVMGAGAVGCYYGFKLARGGHHVVLIGRPQQVEAIEGQELRLETQAFDEHVRVSASNEAVQDAQLVLFCVKSTDTESAKSVIRNHSDIEMTEYRRPFLKREGRWPMLT